MAPPTPKVVIPIDVKSKPWQQKLPLHNRWHPQIPLVVEAKTGEVFRVEMVDWTGGAVKDDDSALDIKCIDPSTVSSLPQWTNPNCGQGWDSSQAGRSTGRVRFAGLTHPGIVGTAPSMELLNIWNERERQLEENGLHSLKPCEVLHQRPLANLPSTKGCVLGKGTPEWEKIAREAARTVPGRENGGNCDIKNLSRGSKVYLPVFVEGANLSTGDMHFSQGDGEISFCGAIEMSGFLELKCEIIREGMKEYLTPMGPTPLHVNPIFEIGPVEPRFSEWLVFEGISVDESGRQHSLDASIAYKRAVLNAIDYLSKFGYSKEQAYLLLSCCPCEGRISGIVDVPNALATLAIPTAIFDQAFIFTNFEIDVRLIANIIEDSIQLEHDIRPKSNKVPVGPQIVRKPDVLKSTYEGNLPITRNPSSTV
ncbi:hypothetical protein FEM48_ZijujUnG0034400 [Ziziphus jujuba var. spinosa]|uniref:Formamidase-like n=1 Tax=Ziziphus jujuba var. spinosa TaxID=714518 RepID=A0A978U9F9_ZIZJJ|nr:hypothetical protein FEM48_ZijujUnG0034400 [Ziziphus jujuba var. spinosa]